MSKCVICTHRNAVAENKKHNNSYTFATVVALRERRRRVKASEFPHRFCNVHAPGIGTGRMTMKLAEALSEEATS